MGKNKTKKENKKNVPLEEDNLEKLENDESVTQCNAEDSENESGKNGRKMEIKENQMKNEVEKEQSGAAIPPNDSLKLLENKITELSKKFEDFQGKVKSVERALVKVTTLHKEMKREKEIILNKYKKLQDGSQDVQISMLNNFWMEKKNALKKTLSSWSRGLKPLLGHEEALLCGIILMASLIAQFVFR